MKRTANRWISFLLCMLLILTASLPGVAETEIEVLQDPDHGLESGIVELFPEDEPEEVTEEPEDGVYESGILSLGDDAGEETGEILSTVYGDSPEQTQPAGGAISASGNSSKDSNTIYVPKNKSGKASLNLSSSCSVKTGSIYSLYCYFSGGSGTVYLHCSYAGSSPFTCSWGSWRDQSIYLDISGTKTGSGTITVELRSYSTGAVIAKKTVKVTVTDSGAKITLSPTSASMQIGKTKKIKVTPGGYSGSYYLSASLSKSDICSTSWGDWSNGAIQLTIKGKKTGSCDITVMMYSSANILLKKAKIKVTVTEAPKISLSVDKVSLQTKKSTDITVKCSGYSGKYTLSAKASNTKLVTCKWSMKSGKNILTITGKKAGTCTVTVTMKDTKGKTLATKKISSVKVANAKKATLSASKTSVDLANGKKTKINLTIKNISAACYVQCSTGKGRVACTLGKKEKNVVPLTIKAQKDGSEVVTATVKQSSNNKVLATVKIKVNIISAMKSVSNVGYGFGNYSKSYISLSLCQYMFGNNQKAQLIYYRNLGSTGCCFGFSTSAGLLDMTFNEPNIGVFGSRSKISQLKKTDRSTALGLSVTDFIEAMHITQASTYMWSQMLTGLDSLVKTVKSETNAGHPVVVAINGACNGKEAGHAILAYGCKQVSDTRFDITIYDCNYQRSASEMKATTLTVTRPSSTSSYNSWSYEMAGWGTWGTGRKYCNLRFWKYSSYQAAWNSRGSTLSSSLNLLSTSAKDFSLYDSKGNLAAQYENGTMIKGSDGVMDIPLFNVLPNGEVADMPVMLYVPVGEYTVISSSSGDPISVSLADNDLAVTVETNASRFSVCANDIANEASVHFPSDANASYSVSLYSGRISEPEAVTLTGNVMGGEVSLGMYGGKLSIFGTDPSDPSISNSSGLYAITAEAGVGGSIAPEGIRLVAEGGSASYTITADAGMKLVSVLVDGADIGPVAEYTFENVREAHTITAVFETIGSGA